MNAEDRLFLKIRKLSDSVWEKRASGTEVEEWLSTFTKNSEDLGGDRIAMLTLLSNFTYFGVNEVRELLAHLYRELYRRPIIQRLRKAQSDPLDIAAVESEYTKTLEKTRFLGVGNPSESGSHLLYYLRQEADLQASLFINHFEAPGFSDVKSDVGHYVFIDDLCASGRQACDYSERVVTRLRNAAPSAHVSYFSLLATTDGLRHVREHSQFQSVQCVMELGEDFKCFSPTSRFWTGEGADTVKGRARDICLRYGQVVYGDYPLGFNDAELAVGFSHNTPDDSLPVFWIRPSPMLPTVRPVFRRYGKRV